ncbi:cytochrome b/b6 domain-containing protein [Pseudomonas sp. MS19]|uniref:cytochrome b n=1 Tax=Pseudomonas sp. MS19 TaxID=2579939 RepID=UPI0015627D74|nr:cytochrome b/b6 domain-containing protein [Pseudomonas sp. MS19]NRH26436.1 hypothetical protein [Pseudomonas sp. MS19]
MDVITPRPVSACTRNLHWLIVLLLSGVYLSAYYRSYLTTQLEVSNWYSLVVHINAGLLVGVFSVLAIVMRRRSGRRGWLAKLSKFALYSLLLLIPLSAYMGLGFKLPIAGYWMLDSFAQLPAARQFVSEQNMLMITFQEPFALFHQEWGSEVLLPALIALHVAAALYHHFILRDQTLRAMLGCGAD